MASSFRTVGEAETFIAETLARNPIARMNVASGEWPLYAISARLGTRTGIIVIPGAPSTAIGNGVTVVIRHDPTSDTGYFILTAYPEHF
jgi:hypothetical protein